MYQQNLLSFMQMIFPNLTDQSDLTPVDLSQELLVINPIESILGKATNEDGFLPLMDDFHACGFTPRFKPSKDAVAQTTVFRRCARHMTVQSAAKSFRRDLSMASSTYWLYPVSH